MRLIITGWTKSRLDAEGRSGAIYHSQSENFNGMGMDVRMRVLEQKKLRIRLQGRLRACNILNKSLTIIAYE